jgi:hypothetical protein
MPDLLFHLAPTAIRGTAASDEAAPLFAVYDLIDIVGRKRYLLHPRKRGAFSRDVWARLTHVPSGRPKTALESLASIAPIRASATRNRTTDMLVMPVPSLLLLIEYVMHDAQRHATISDQYKRHARYVKETLETLQKGDCSMLQTLTEPAPEADAPDTARPHKKRKKAIATTAATDVILRFSSNKIIFGTVHPVHEHVFSAYAFIDLIGRQLHQASNCAHFARRFWAYKISKDPYLRSVFVTTPIRCSASFPRKTNTPALPIQGLGHLIRLMLNQPNKYKGQWKNKIYIPVDHKTVDPIGEILDTYIAGDRSMIEEIIECNGFRD